MSEQLAFEFGSPSEPGPSCLLDALTAAADAAPRGRKLIVAATLGEGRELLRQLALARGSWVGFEVTTIMRLAVEVAAPRLAAERLHVLDEFDEQAVMDQAIDDVLLTRHPGPLSPLAEGVGFRATLRNAIKTLRLGGVSAGRVRGTRLEDTAKREALGRVLSRFEALLKSKRLVDQAGVIARATQAIQGDEVEAPLGAETVHLVPGLGLRGLSGGLIRALLNSGAQILETDPVRGLSPPDSVLWNAGTPRTPLSFVHAPDSWEGEPPALQSFSASGVTEELREVLRRVGSMGLRWDEVEIVTPDPAVYGSALHSLAGSLDISVSYGVGLPIERTRPGRAVAAYFRWIEGGFGADVIRTLLASGDLVPPLRKDWIPPARLARRLRSLRIGWGRARYVRLIDVAYDSAERSGQGRRESPEALDRRRTRALKELGALRSILGPILRSTPQVPRALDEDVRVSPAALATGLRIFLRCVRPVDAVDETALERLGRQLDRAEATLDREVTYRGAASTLRGYLQMRVPAPRAEGSAPWSSAGAQLFLTDIVNGGLTGRPATFVVGLDAVRFPGGGIQDPLLLDSERWLLAKGALPRSTDRQRETTFRLAALFARLRGAVTLSYCAWDPAEARVIPPALEMLLAHRLSTGRLSAGFEDLRSSLEPPAGPIPRGRERLDARDVWLGSLVHEGRLLAGEVAVREGFVNLAAGLVAGERRADPVPNVYHGLVEPRPDELDPRRNHDRVMSASRLENLGRCQRKYLFQSILRIWVPDDPELDPERWLDARHRGDLLHGVYDRALREARERAADIPFEDVALQVLEVEAAKKLNDLPSPSAAVRDKEMVALRADVAAFARMATPILDRWIETELRFGLQGDQPVAVEVAGGTVLMRGAIDRVDRLPEGLTVSDYKTGKVRGYEPGTGAFNGGRRLQNWLYTEVAERRLGESVAWMEYAFPTERGQNESIRYLPAELSTGGDLIGMLLDAVADGHFFPTDDPGDCTFCDYRDLCGVRETRRGIDSPLADWASEAMSMHQPLLRLRRARHWETS